MNLCITLYQKLIYFASRLQSLFLFFIRLIWGHQFFLAGLHFFSPIKTPPIPLQAWLSSSSHPRLLALLLLAGGILLMIGLGSRLVALLLALFMISALAATHKDIFLGGHFLWNPGLLVRAEPFPFLLI